MGKFTTVRGKAPSVHISRMNHADVEKDYNEINFLETDDRKLARIEMFIAKTIGAELAKCYPKREWAVYCDVTGGIVRIGCDSLSYDRGYILHIGQRSTTELVRAAKMAAGEILERFNVSRSQKFDEGELEDVPRDFRDEAISADAIPEDLTKALRKY